MEQTLPGENPNIRDTQGRYVALREMLSQAQDGREERPLLPPRAGEFDLTLADRRASKEEMAHAIP